MRAGEVVGDRFEILRTAGSGGMGEVFLARDRVKGELVAVKVLLDGRSSDRARFEREAEALSELRHPGIVQYVAHGETAGGVPYLAMEWLSGEDLAARLKRGRLGVEETVALGLRVAETLGAAHARGIVHRDLKPSNLFLVDGSVERVKVLDFGIAWLGDTTRMTRTGVVIGTPGYMAPEQARAGSDIDARADVFSLGCVLFECLTGARAFSGEHVMTLLAQILFVDAPDLRALRDDVPAGLEALIARMLAKEPARRPRHGLDVADALSALEAPTFSAPQPPETPRAPALSPGERRLLSVVLLGREQPIGLGATQTVGKTGISPALIAMRQKAEASGGRLELLVDGSVLVTITGAGIAADLCARAARCALALRDLGEGRPIALSTGRGEVAGKLLPGDAIDRAARRLSPRALRGRDERAIAVDDVTAGLLDGRFDVRGGAEGQALYGEREHTTGVRAPLGEPLACVGRDRELGTLRALFDECVEEPVARVALVTAAPGMGKTRLADELLREIQARGAEVWIGRADAQSAGVMLRLLGQVIRGAAGILEGDTPAAGQEKLRARVERHVPPADRARVAELLGELCAGTPRADEVSLRRAWEDLVAAECAAHPLLILLDDLHWGDVASVRLIGATLGALRASPWMVLGLARPEIHEIFPRLWVERDAQQIRLDQLTRRAGERLVKQVLGPAAARATVDRLLLMADGNPACLGELIRAFAEGKGDAPSEAAIAMMEGRIASLEAPARRVLRAASVFGDVFSQGGVEALLGGELRAAEIAEWLSLLVERDILVPRPERRIAGETALGFRHPLLREAAYAMLTDSDRVLGHRLAAAYLAAHEVTVTPA